MYYETKIYTCSNVDLQGDNAGYKHYIIATFLTFMSILLFKVICQIAFKLSLNKYDTQ